MFVRADTSKNGATKRFQAPVILFVSLYNGMKATLTRIVEKARTALLQRESSG